MSVADIVREIDAYLMRLTQARDLLAESIVAEGRDKAPRAPGVTRVRETRQARRSAPLSTARTVAEEEGGDGEMDLPSPAPVTAPQALPVPTPAQPAAPVLRFPAPSPAASTPEQQPVVHRVRSAPSRTRTPRPRAPASAPALGGSVPSGWIGVSAEEAKRAREQTVAQPAPVPHFEPPATALAGRQAFEAIFGGGSEAAEEPLQPVSED